MDASTRLQAELPACSARRPPNRPARCRKVSRSCRTTVQADRGSGSARTNVSRASRVVAPVSMRWKSAETGIGGLGHRSRCPMPLSVVHVAARHDEGTTPACAALVPRGEDVAEEVETAWPRLAGLPRERHFTGQAVHQPYRLRHRTRAPAHPRPQPLRHVATLERLASGRRLLDRRAERLMLVTRATTGLAVGQLRTAKAGRTLRCAPVLARRWRVLGLYVSRALGSARVAPTAAIDGLPEAEPKSSGVTA